MSDIQAPISVTVFGILQAAWVFVAGIIFVMLGKKQDKDMARVVEQALRCDLERGEEKFKELTIKIDKLTDALTAINLNLQLLINGHSGRREIDKIFLKEGDGKHE